MTNDKQTKKFVLKNRRAISPILATVVLLGITVVAGGLVFSLFSTSAASSSNTDVIAIQNAQAVKGTSHADLTATVKNAGSQPWTSIEMTVGKSELSEPILYESLHENVVGCSDATADETEFSTLGKKCDGTGNGGTEGAPAGGRDNPLRAQWLISLDKTSGSADDVADKGEGAAVGRKLVFQSKDDLRTFTILNGTAVSSLFTGGKGPNDTFSTYAGNIDTADKCTLSGVTDCSDTFKALDSSTKGKIFCEANTSDDDIVAKCYAFTHTNIKDSPISPGQSVYFYADAFTNEISGLNNQVLRVGDNIVVNIASENGDGGTARVQTIIKVAGT